MELQACRVCLTTDRHLQSFSEKSVINAFEDVIGFPINLNTSLPNQICFVCKARVLRYSKFKKCCQYVQSLLETKVYNNVQITHDILKEISSTLPSYNLSISKTTVTNNNIDKKSDPQDINYLIQKQDIQEINDFIQSNSIISGGHETSDNIINTIDSQYPDYIDVNIKNEYTDESHKGFDYEVLKIDYDDKEFNKNDEISSENINFYDNIESCLNDERKVYQTDGDGHTTNKLCKNNTILQNLKDRKIKKGKSRKKSNNNENVPLIKLKEVLDNNKKKVKEYTEKNIVTSKNLTKSNSKGSVRSKKLIKSNAEEPVKRRVQWSESMNEKNLSKYNMKLRFLTKEEQIQKMLSRKESDKYKKSRFKCEQCCKPYMTEKAFEKHNTLHQPSADRRNECKLCHVYLTARQHKEHIRAHRTELTCALCHTELEPRTSAIRNHSAFHAGVKFECVECNKVYHHYSTYINHKSARHSDTTCSLCGDTFCGLQGIARHMHKSHAQESCEQCDKCKHYFYNKGSIQQHMLSCNTDSSPCGRCGVSFKSATELRTHIASEHQASTLKRHVCSECGRTFRKENTLITHWRKEHQDREFVRRAPRRYTRPPGQVTKRTDSKPKKNCICDQCGEMLSWGCHLRVHMLKHTGEKPHQCDQCDKSFRLAAQLRLHARVHSGEKPYKCSECATAFRQVSHLNGHMRIHTGSRPYPCGVCPKAFALKINRDAHVRSVHEGQPARRRGGGRGTAHAATCLQ